MGYKIEIGNDKVATQQGGSVGTVTNTETGIIEPIALFCGRDGERTAIGRNGELYTCKPYEPAYTLVDGKMVLSEEPLGENLNPYSSDLTNWAGKGSNTVLNKIDNYTNVVCPVGSGSYVGNTFPATTGVSYVFSVRVKGTGSLNIGFGTAVDNVANKVSLNIDATSEYSFYEVVWVADGTQTFSYGIDNQSNTTSFDIDVQFCQLEVGEYRTSPIETNGTTGVRLAATGTKTPNISKYINSEEGVFQTKIRALSNDLTPRAISINNGASNSYRIRYNEESNTVQALVIASGIPVQDIEYEVYDITEQSYIELVWNNGTVSFRVDGVKVGEEFSVSSPIGISKVNFDEGSGVTPFYGITNEINVYDSSTDIKTFESPTELMQFANYQIIE